MLRRMVVGLNSSELSREAGELAIAWAKTHAVSMLGVGVVDPTVLAPAEPVPLGGASFKHERDEAVLASARQNIAELLGAFQKSAEAAGVSVVTVQLEGNADDLLAQECKRGDLLVVGLKHRGNDDVTLPVSDTLEAVLKKAARPVLCVPASVTTGQTVVVAYDGSVPAARALSSLVNLGLFKDHIVKVIAVEEVPGEHVASLTAANEFLTCHGYQTHIETVPLTASVADSLLARIAALKPCLVVMGTHGKGWLREMLFGSVTKTLLGKVSVPVLFDH